jgi:hypothetical protein
MGKDVEPSWIDGAIGLINEGDIDAGDEPDFWW